MVGFITPGFKLFKKRMMKNFINHKKRLLKLDNIMKLQTTSVSAYHLLMALALDVLLNWVGLGLVGCDEGVVYLTSPGRPTDIGLQFGKACYSCSR